MDYKPQLIVTTHPMPDAHTQRVLCVDAHVDPRTLRKYFCGGRVMPMARERIETALERSGYSSRTAAGVQS